MKRSNLKKTLKARRAPRRGFPSGFRRIVVAETVYFFKVGDQHTEIREALDGDKKVVANWTLLGMNKQTYFDNRITQGAEEFSREGGCQCWKCDCDIAHLRYEYVIYPSTIAEWIKGNFNGSEEKGRYAG
jgi:hypothetical protein